MSDKSVRLFHATYHRPESHRTMNGTETDDYDGVQLPVVLSYLKGEPIVTVRLTDEEALTLAAELTSSVRDHMKGK